MYVDVLLVYLQMEFRGHHVHAARRLSALLAQEADADAAYDFIRELRLLFTRVGRPLRHCERFGRQFFFPRLLLQLGLSNNT